MLLVSGTLTIRIVHFLLKQKQTAKFFTRQNDLATHDQFEKSIR